MGDHVQELRFKEIEANEIHSLLEIVRQKNDDLQIEN